jgi:hypothetical protein
MNKQIEELKSYISQTEVLNDKVSLGKVGWHIHHCFGVMNWTGLALMRSKPEDFKPSFNLKRTYVFTIGKFPRGKIKVPRNSVQSPDVTLELIEKEIKTTERILEKMNTLPKNSFMKHPIFGEINLKQSNRFLSVHNEHHLKIIRDILFSN